MRIDNGTTWGRTLCLLAACWLLLGCSDSSRSAADGSDAGGTAGAAGGAAGAPAGHAGSTSPTRVAGARDASAGADTGVADSGSAGGDAAIAPNPRLADLADGTAMDLGAFECTAPSGEDEDGCRRVTDYSGLVYDARNHQLLMFGGGHSTTMTDAIFAFDLDDTLRWRELYLPTPCDLMVASNLDAALGAWQMGPAGPYPRPLSVHTYDLNAFAPERNEFLLLSRMFTGGYCNTVGNDVGGNVAHFSLEDEAWSFSDTANATPSTAIPASERDPVSGLIVVLGAGGLKLYDPTARVYTDSIDSLPDAQGGPFDMEGLGYANHLVYFAPDDTFYFFVRGQPVEVIALVLDRAQPERSTLEAVPSTGPTSPHSEPGYDYDSVNAIIGGGVFEDTFYACDPSTATWSAHTIAGGTPGDQAFHAIGYDPANNVFVFRAEYDSGQHTWAYRFRARP
jgi:hypothetical protein